MENLTFRESLRLNDPEFDHVPVERRDDYNISYEEFDYDMVYVTQFYHGKLWVVWKEVSTGNTYTSEFEEIGYEPEHPVA